MATDDDQTHVRVPAKIAVAVLGSLEELDPAPLTVLVRDVERQLGRAADDVVAALLARWSAATTPFAVRMRIRHEDCWGITQAGEEELERLHRVLHQEAKVVAFRRILGERRHRMG